MADLVDIASKEVGNKETGNNKTKYGKWNGSDGLAWCHAFVSWCAYKAGILDKYVPKTGSCSSGYGWYRSKKMAIVTFQGKMYKPNAMLTYGLEPQNYEPKRNDVIYFLNGRSHVGIVEYYDKKNDEVHTIEGNTGIKCDGVYRCKYKRTDLTIIGYGLASKAFERSKDVKSKPTSTSKRQSSVPAITTPSTRTTTSTPSTSKNTKQSNVAKETTKQELAYLKKILDKNKNTAKVKQTTQEVDVKVADRKASSNLNLTLVVNHNSTFYQLPVLDGATVTWERKGTPGKLEFTTILKKKLVSLGDPVMLSVGKKKFFYGFVFTIKPQPDRTVTVTVYDQLRYFKNKDTWMYKKKTATMLLRAFAKQYHLKVYNKLPNTKYAASRIDDNMTLFDIFENNLDETMWSTGKMYVLYDDFGRLRLREPWRVNVLIDEETGQSYDYSISIDSDVYNKVKLAYDNKKTGKQEYFISQSQKSINKWGVLQYFEKIDSPKLGKLKGQVLLKAYNKEARTFSVTDCFGDANVRAGCVLPVMLKLYDEKVAYYMLVDKVTHKFDNSSHTMDLALSGGDFDTTEQ